MELAWPGDSWGDPSRRGRGLPSGSRPGSPGLTLMPTHPLLPLEANGLDQRDLETPGPERPEEDPLRGRGGGSRAASEGRTG